MRISGLAGAGSVSKDIPYINFRELSYQLLLVWGKRMDVADYPMNPFPSIIPDLSLNPSRIGFSPVTAEDFDEVSKLRLTAMKESLERAGRFDPEQARARLRETFHPEHSRFILLDSGRVGFHTFRPLEDAYHLDHLYIHPLCQGLGIGSFVLGMLITLAKERRHPIRTGILRDSASNTFYERHGFVKISEEDWHVHYERRHD